MKCPVCNQAMAVLGKEITQNFESGKKYLRTNYHCAIDDIWILVETPTEERNIA